MPVPIAKESRALLLALVLTGCADDQPGSAHQDATLPSQSTSADALQVDACAIALAAIVSVEPGGAKAPAEQSASRYRHPMLRGARAVPHLERLGWTLVELARVRSDPGFYTLAEHIAQCIEAKRPGSAEALLLRGHVLHHRHRFKEAEATARQLVAQRGTWFDQGLLGDVLMEQGKLDAAIDAYQLMMDERPGPQAYSRAAHVRWLRGDLAGAIEMMRKAAQASGARHSEARAWALVHLALYRLQAGELKAAHRLVEDALAWHPRYAPALLARGRMLLAQAKYEDAIPYLTRATERNPLPEYQWALIEALRAAGRQEDAVNIEVQLKARGAIEDRRTYALYLATIGREPDTARRLALRELTEREDVFTLDAVAWALHASGQHQQALALSRRALAEGTQDARLYYHAGVIAVTAGATKQASQWLARGIAMQQTLLPSERADLAKEFAALASQIPSPASAPMVPGHPITQ